MKRIAIIGFKFMGTTHAQVYQRIAGAELTAIVDRNPDRATKILEKFGLRIPVYPTVGALISSEEVDVIDICLPTDLHAAVVLEAIAAGKHVFCEKPLALNLADAESICRAAAASAVSVQVGHCIRFWPEYQVLADLVRSRKYGRLLNLSLQRRAPRPSSGKDNWLNNPQRSGGAALDLHIHDTDFVCSLLGLPQAVTSVGTRDEGGWSYLHTLYHYDRTAVAAEGGWNLPEGWGFQMAFQAVFEQAIVEFDSRHNPSLTVTRNGEETLPLLFDEPDLGASLSELGNISALGGYFNQLSYFISCLEENVRPAIATLDQARDSLSIVLAEIESAEKDCRVELQGHVAARGKADLLD